MPLPRKNNPDLTLLRSVLAYIPETGQFFYRQTRGQQVAGSPAGHVNERGYVVIVFCRKPLLAHRVAIAFQDDKWPTQNVDHMNGNKSDNRIENLREVSQALNVAAANMRRHLRGESLGVRFKKGSWETSIKTDGHEVYLGRFKTEHGAQLVYIAAASLYHGPGVFDEGPSAAVAELRCGNEFITPKVAVPTLTQSRLRLLVNYDPETGVMSRKVSYRGRKCGVPIGHRDLEGYVHLKVGGRSYVLHRLAHFYMTGAWPVGEIHHINHNPSDNRWYNLADVSPLENNRLRRKHGSNPKDLHTRTTNGN